MGADRILKGIACVRGREGNSRDRNRKQRCTRYKLCVDRGSRRKDLTHGKRQNDLPRNGDHDDERQM